MKKKTWIYGIFAVLLLFLGGWLVFYQSTRIKFSPIPVGRYDVALMEMDTDKPGEELQRLYQKYPMFLEGADLNDPHFHQYFIEFVTDSFSIALQKDVMKKYPDLKPLEKVFGKSFAIYHQSFARGEKMPEIYTYLSNLDYDNRVIFQDSVLLIGLDLYLGKNYPFYNMEYLPMYIRERMESRFIAVDAMKEVAFFELNKTAQPHTTLLDHLIFYGKVLCFLEETLPDSEPEDWLGYTEEQLKWCEKSEEMMWAYLMESQSLYAQDWMVIRKFVEESPTIQVFPGSPGRIGHFIGYQIVKACLRKTGQTLPELFAEQDAQKILKLSNYRP